mgnify:CR=1 FL=1
MTAHPIQPVVEADAEHERLLGIHRAVANAKEGFLERLAESLNRQGFGPHTVNAALDELRTEEIVYPGDPDPRDALLADVHAAHIQALARAATAERERDALREQIGSAAATLATDAVKEPLALDISGPKKDEAAIRRFVASSSFAVVLETVTATARLRLRRDLSAWCKKQADERLVDLFDGVEPEKAEGFAEAMTAIIAHLGSLK